MRAVTGVIDDPVAFTGGGRTAEERHQADLRRALLEVDRKRSAATKVQKEVDQARRLSAEQADQHRTQIDALPLELGPLRQRLRPVKHSAAPRSCAPNGAARRCKCSP